MSPGQAGPNDPWGKRVAPYGVDMFVRYHATVPRPLEECKAILLQAPEEWLPHVVTEALKPGDDLVARMGFSIVRKRALVHLDEPRVLRDWVQFPIAWEADPVSEAFPRFEGDLQLVPIDPGVTKVAVAGSYDPPLGAVGRALDSLLLHTAAEATVKDFIDSVARRLRTAVLTRSA